MSVMAAETAAARDAAATRGARAERAAENEARQRRRGQLQAAASGARAAQQAVGHGRFHNYQAIILAEFIAAELLVAATPIATRKHKTGLSPYLPRDMTKLLAIGILFFILELTSVGGRRAGRVGAWFGGLILLGVGLNEGANITKTLDVFSGIGTSTAKPKAGTTPIPTNLPSPPPSIL